MFKGVKPTNLEVKINFFIMQCFSLFIYFLIGRIIMSINSAVMTRLIRAIKKRQIIFVRRTDGQTLA